jgi:Tfp pilus assembly protein PilF
MKRFPWRLVLVLLPALNVGCIQDEYLTWPFSGAVYAFEDPSLREGGVTRPPARVEGELPPDKSAELCLSVARELERKDQSAEAIAMYEKARRENPRLPVAHRLGVLHDRRGEPELARDEYEVALKAAPHDPDLLNDVGYFHAGQGEWAEAECCYRQCLELQPKHAKAWVNLGVTLANLHRYAESCDAFGRVLKPAEANYNVGVILAHQGQLEQARGYLRRALELDPELGKAQAIEAYLDRKGS